MRRVNMHGQILQILDLRGGLWYKKRVPAIHIDRRNAAPLHLQIERQLRALIRRQDYRNGKLLPDEVSLARDLGVSRNTLRAAVERLVREGLLVRTRRVGTRVARGGPLKTSLTDWHSFTEEMRRQGITVENLRVSARKQPAPAEVAQALGIETGTPALRLRRLRGWGGLPALLAESWLHPRLGLAEDMDFSRPLYETIARVARASPALSREELTAVATSAEQARELAVRKGTPLLLRRRTTLDRRGRPIEHNLNYYRPDRYTLTLDLQ
jgi:GntR family transcriptional regulator